MATFRVLRQDVWSGGLQLGDLKGFDEDFLLGRGVTLAATYPRKVSFAVNTAPVTRSGPERPGAAGKTKASTRLTDALRNLEGLLVVSERMRALIAGAEPRVEFLPVAIQGHTEPYAIANLLDHVPCLDAKRSGAKSSPRKPDEVRGVKKLVLRTAEIPADRTLFQIKEYPKLFLVRDDLARALEAAQLTGIELLDVSAYDGG